MLNRGNLAKPGLVNFVTIGLTEFVNNKKQQPNIQPACLLLHSSRAG